MRMQMTAVMVMLVGLLTGAAQAAEGKADMAFHGTLIAPPPCTINDGEQIDVDFGERVGISRVDGVNYRMPVNYQIRCEQTVAGQVMSLSLNGTATGFDGQALQTNKSNMGIRIYRNDVPFTPNSVVNINPTNPPVLEAVPVKQAGSTLTEGAFEALATLQANYQ